MQVTFCVFTDKMKLDHTDTELKGLSVHLIISLTLHFPLHNEAYNNSYARKSSKKKSGHRITLLIFLYTAVEISLYTPIIIAGSTSSIDFWGMSPAIAIISL